MWIPWMCSFPSTSTLEKKELEETGFYVNKQSWHASLLTIKHSSIFYVECIAVSDIKGCDLIILDLC